VTVEKKGGRWSICEALRFVPQTKIDDSGDDGDDVEMGKR
jgi:hypothetical protein